MSASGRSWLHCVALCNFDLDQGQTISKVFPSDALYARERRQIAHSAFPEACLYASESKCYIVDSVFFFRIPRMSEGSDTDGDDTLDASEFLYCYVFARQRKDDRLVRGAAQDAAVLVSPLPHTAVLLPLVAAVGSHLLASFAAHAQHLISLATREWPEPVPGRVVTLSVGPLRVAGVTADASCLPPPLGSSGLLARGSACGETPSGAPVTRRVAGLFEDRDLFGIFQNNLTDLWRLWEVMLLAQPVLVFSRSVEVCSDTVAALVGLVSPLQYAGDFRPVFGMHDPEAEAIFDHATDESPSGHAGPTVIGVTNPYFLHATAQFPTRVKLPTLRLHSMSSASAPAASSAMPAAYTPVSRSSPSLRPSALRAIFSGRGSGNLDYGGLEDGAVDVQVGFAGVCSRADRQVVAKLRMMDEGPLGDGGGAPCGRGGGSVRTAGLKSSVLRRYFSQLTVAFLGPFLEFAGMVATEGGDGRGCQRDWDELEFLDHLQSRGVPEAVLSVCGSIDRAVTLYLAFMDSENFYPLLSAYFTVPE